MKLEELFEGGSNKEIQAERDRFDSALAELVRDEDEPELTEKELKAKIDGLVQKYKLTPSQRRHLALAAEGPIGY